MNRRDFQTGLFATGLAGSVPLAAAASEQEDRGREVLGFSRVRLQLLQAAVVLNWFLIASQSGILGLRLTQEARRFDEDRADIGALPLIGQLQRAPLARRFAAAVMLGHLVLLNRSLILLPIVSQNLARKKVVIAHRDESWEPAGRTGPVQIPGFPALPVLSQLMRVGTAHLKGDSLLLIVKPSLVTLPEE